MNVRVGGWRAVLAIGLVALSSTGAWAQKEVSVEMETLQVEARTDLLLRELEGLKLEVQTLRTEIALIDATYSDYREHHRNVARRMAAGDQYDSLACEDGRTFEDVTVRSIDAVGLLIRHRNGSTRIPYQVLPSSLQERFGWDALEATALLENEEAEAGVRQRLMNIASAKMEERRERAAATAKIYEAGRAEARRLLAQRARTQSPVSLAASGLLNSGRLGERRTVGSGSSSSYRYRRSSRTTRTRVYYRPSSSCYTRPRPSPCRPRPSRPASTGG